jgi:hypothetical protein
MCWEGGVAADGFPTDDVAPAMTHRVSNASPGEGDDADSAFALESPGYGVERTEARQGVEPGERGVTGWGKWDHVR